METESGLLWLDGHSSRLSARALEALMDHNIVAVTIPAHSSHVLQPLDREGNGVFKSALRGQPIGGATRAERRGQLLAACDHASYIAHAPKTVKAGFRVSGIFPWDPSRVLMDRRLVPADDDQGPQSEKPKKKSPKKIPISGRVITSTRLVEELKERDKTS